MAASACSSCNAAVLLANVSGTLVPRATIETPLAAVLSPITQPRREASWKYTQISELYEEESEFDNRYRYLCFYNMSL